MTASSAPAVDRTGPKYLAREYAARLDDLKAGFVGRDEAVEVVGLATLCREHVLLIGPPGTAKTALLTRFGAMFHTDPFTYLLTRFTEPTELFGPVDVRRFQDERVFKVNTEGMLPTARLAFLDEVFEGSSAILNALLTLMNERVFYNGSTPEHSDLITLLGSSNDVPDDPVLAAFSDRFLLRCELDYVDDDDIGRVLDVGWLAEQRLMSADRPSGAAAEPDRDAAGFELDSLATLQDAVAKVDLAPIRASYTEILRELRTIQGVAFSDRRAVKAQKVFAASALLAGRNVVEMSDLGALEYLWADRRDKPALRRVLEEHGVEPARPSGRVPDVAEIRWALHVLVNQRARLRTVQDLRELSHQIQLLGLQLRKNHPGAVEAQREVQREQHRTLTMMQEKFQEEGLDV